MPKRPDRYEIGKPVRRDDGRHYVPVMRKDFLFETKSQTVLRVADDAFPSLGDAQRFALALTHAMNRDPYL